MHNLTRIDSIDSMQFKYQFKIYFNSKLTKLTIFPLQKHVPTLYKHIFKFVNLKPCLFAETLV